TSPGSADHRTLKRPSFHRAQVAQFSPRADTSSARERTAPFESRLPALRAIEDVLETARARVRKRLSLAETQIRLRFCGGRRPSGRVVLEFLHSGGEVVAGGERAGVLGAEDSL
ncbi:MAG: hypothetical protein QOI98_3313, partial [Solirubrobacteraceae bacterium]|nr:hypothetical protein [Solirubrobacteraceae bacterium]